MLDIVSREKVRVLLLEGVHPKARESFESFGYSNITEIKKALHEEELRERIKNTDILGIRSKTNLNKKVLEDAGHLFAIGCFCIGTNQVDLTAAEKKGVPVFNAPYGNTRSVAELVMGEVIMLMRKIFAFSSNLHRGIWEKSSSGCYELRGKTIGIVGLGHIGSQVSVLAEAFGMHVFYYDIEPKLPIGNAKDVGSLGQLLQMSDVVTLHVPETPETKDMITSSEFALMKEGSIFINASRGTVVNLEDLKSAVDSKHIKGAAIDVYPSEPSSNGAGFESPVVGDERIILTPHIGGSTVEAQENIAVDVSTKLAKFCTNGSTVGAVNFPQLNLSYHKNVHRILHIHQNIPGVLRGINRVFAERKINVLGQNLNTLAELGYVVIDIECADNEQLLAELTTIEGTIKTRIIS